MPFLIGKIFYFTFKYEKCLVYYENTDYFCISMRREKFRATPGTMRKIRLNVVIAVQPSALANQTTASNRKKNTYVFFLY